jgi:hypothetical protein
MRRLLKVTAAVLVVMLAFFAGAIVDARMAVSTEANLHYIALMDNLAILSECKKRACDENMQGLLIAENDMSLFKLYTSQDFSGAFPGFGHALVSIVVLMDTHSVDMSKWSDNIRARYKSLDCGLDGKVCHSAN